MAEHSKIFPPYYIGILKSAELTGQLDVSLEQLSGYIERDLDSKSKIKAAMLYPMVIAGMSMLTVVILSVWVMPKFVVFFKNLKAKLPLPDAPAHQHVGGVAEVLVRRGALLFVLFVALVIWMHKSSTGRLAPRPPLPAGAADQGRRALRGHRAGVPHRRRDGEGRRAAPRDDERRDPGHEQQGVREGSRVAPVTACSRARAWPSRSATRTCSRAATQMMRVGEDTGTLDIQLESAAEYYGRELEYKLKKLTGLFEPAVIIFMGLIVGFVAVALISAMYGVFNSSNLLPKK